MRTHEDGWERYAYPFSPKPQQNEPSPEDWLRASSSEYTVEAFSQSGDMFYVLNTQEKRLYKLRTWW